FHQAGRSAIQAIQTESRNALYIRRRCKRKHGSQSHKPSERLAGASSPTGIHSPRQSRFNKSSRNESRTDAAAESERRTSEKSRRFIARRRRHSNRGGAFSGSRSRKASASSRR